MIPDIDLRLQNTLKALREVVLPALPASEALAREQAQLVIAHLGIIALQWKAALGFELAAYDSLCALARSIAGQAASSELAMQVDTALAAAVTLDRTDYARVSGAARELGALVARLIDGDGTTAALGRDMLDAVLAYSERQALRERAWFAACGLDPDRDKLPDLESSLG